MKYKIIALGILTMLFFYGCSKGSFGKDIAKIEIDPQEQDVKIQEGVVAKGQTYDYVIHVKNVGTRDLVVKGIDHTYHGCKADKGDALKLDVEKGVKFPVTIVPVGSGEGREDMTITVHYTRPDDTCAGRYMDIIIHNTSADEALREFKIHVEVEKAVPRIGATPATVDFGQVLAGTQRNVDLEVKNIGTGDLIMNKIICRADTEGFSFKVKLPNKEEKVYPIPGGDSMTLKFDPPLELWDYQSITFHMVYKAATNDPATGQIIFMTNDKDFPPPDGFIVKIQANVGGPCLRAEPANVDFGAVTKGSLGVQVVKLTGCGDQDVSITSIALSKDSSKDFSLDLSGLDNVPSEKNPLVVQPKMSQKLVVKYLPLKVDKDAHGGIVPDLGAILIKNSSPLSTIKVGVKGMGVDASAPIADFSMEARICDPPNCNPSPGDMKNCVTKVVKDGDTVPPQTNIQMHDLSTDPTPGGGISHWQWAVAGPPEGNAIYRPTAEFPEPQICLNVAGDYNFMLTVLSKSGMPSKTTQKSLKVSSGQGLHIELTWHTPNDPDETDECGKDKNCGSDMDLHFLHPNAYGQGVPQQLQGVTNPGYFAQRGGEDNPGWDCYWNNPHPMWVKPDQAPPGQDPNPNLDRDDTDGLGPENLNLKNPQVFQNGACYRVGVHYFDDHGFGTSFATVKIYVNGKLVWKNPNPVAMDGLDLWDVAEICWADSVDKVQIKPIKPPSGQGYVIYHQVKSMF